MCVNCVSNVELWAGQLGLAVAIGKAPLHRALARAGLVAPVDPVARDVRTIEFLRRLDLDPVEVLGDDVVEAAEQWLPQPYFSLRDRLAASARPIGSHSLLSVQ